MICISTFGCILIQRQIRVNPLYKYISVKVRNYVCVVVCKVKIVATGAEHFKSCNDRVLKQCTALEAYISSSVAYSLRWLATTCLDICEYETVMYG